VLGGLAARTTANQTERRSIAARQSRQNLLHKPPCEKSLPRGGTSGKSKDWRGPGRAPSLA